MLTAVGLPQLASRLDEEAHWNRMLSLGEQQRLGIARALLHAPQYLFLDEATASLDEPAEAALYRLLEEKLPATTIVSIGHRSTWRRSTSARSRWAATATIDSTHCGPASRAETPRKAQPVSSGNLREQLRRSRRNDASKQKGRQIALPPLVSRLGTKTYFRLVIAVRSNESLAMPAAPHQFEPVPPGLIGVTLVVPVER